jgi:hypothetical protein
MNELALAQNDHTIRSRAISVMKYLVDERLPKSCDPYNGKYPRRMNRTLLRYLLTDYIQ